MTARVVRVDEDVATPHALQESVVCLIREIIDEDKRSRSQHLLSRSRRWQGRASPPGLWRAKPLLSRHARIELALARETGTALLCATARCIRTATACKTTEPVFYLLNLVLPKPVQCTSIILINKYEPPRSALPLSPAARLKRH